MEPKLTKPCTFYLVRHGQTEWNLKGIMQGQLDSSLTPQGIAQARQLAQKFKTIKFAVAFSSDLLRAKRTADIIAAEHKLAVITNQLLRERHFGSWQGRSRTDLNKEFAHINRQLKKLSDTEKKHYRYQPDIENDAELTTRTITFLREIALVYPNNKVLVVTHGGILRILLISMGLATYEHPPTITNTSYIELLSDGTDFHIKDTYGIEFNHQ